MTRLFSVLLVLVAYLTPCVAMQDTISTDMASPAQITEGEKLFTMYCKACHQLERRLVGPPLQDVRQRRGEEWIVNFVKSATTVIESGDSVANALFEEYNRVLMPDQPLDNEQIKSVLAYLDHSAEAEQAGPPIPRPVDALAQGPDPFRFDDFGFWITYTICVVLLIITMYFLVENFSISHPEEIGD